MLAIKDLCLKLPSRKLALRFLGPLKVDDVVRTQAYRLILPPKYQIYNVFNVSYLELYYQRPSKEVPEMPNAILMEDSTEEYKVKKIIGKHAQYVIFIIYDVSDDSVAPSDSESMNTHSL